MAKKWSTGWVVLPATAKTPRQHQHRPHPDRPGCTCCDRVIPEGLRPSRLAIPGVPFCPRCEATAAQRYRAQRNRNRAKLAKAQREKDKTTIADTDAYDRSKNASRSIRAARGGLPGLGRRH